MEWKAHVTCKVRVSFGFKDVIAEKASENFRFCLDSLYRNSFGNFVFCDLDNFVSF